MQGGDSMRCAWLFALQRRESLFSHPALGIHFFQADQLSYS